MKSHWINSVLPIAAIFSFRMLGLFMLIPVFTVYAIHLDEATPALIGIALGGYGLTQGLLQMPMGLLSDKFGRIPIITLGLIFLTAGSVLGAVTDSIYGMIIARMLQGMGAIGSVLIALLADLTPDTERTKAMAVIGATIGLSFSLAMILSPTLAAHFGLPGIFYFTALLALGGLGLLYLVIPKPRKESFHLDSETEPSRLKSVLVNYHLQRLNIGIFCQHFILTSTFFVIPFLLQQYIHSNHITASWKFYLPLMLGSFIAMLPLIAYAEKKQKIKPVFLLTVFLTALCQLLLACFYQSWLGFYLLLFVFFVAFNFLEANLPSLVSRQAGAKSKGTAMGVYSSCQFMGIFVGGVTAGIIYQDFGASGVFTFNMLVGLVWLVIAAFMKPNVYETTLILHCSRTKHSNNDLIRHLKRLPGVKKVALSPEENVIYLQVNKAMYKSGSAERILNGQN